MVVAVDDLARHARLAASGPVEDVSPVVAGVLAEGGPRYRPIGDDALITELCVALPDLAPTPPFGWMHTSVAPAPEQRATLAATRDELSIQALLDDAFPHSLARPGLPGVARWWVFRDGSSVTACAADAWSAPGLGLLAGVAVSRQTRGRGQARAVVSAALEALVNDYGSAGLMVETGNTPARKLYESFAMSYRLLRTAVPGAASR